MRNLTDAEINMVAGEGDVVVNGRLYRDWSMSDGGGGGSVYDNGNGGVYYSPTLVGGENYGTVDHVDRSDLSNGDVRANLTDVSQFHYTIAGHDVLVVIDNATFPLGSDERNRAIQAVQHYQDTMQANPSLAGRNQDLGTIVFCKVDAVGGDSNSQRSASSESTQTFYYDYREIDRESAGFSASAIWHDAGHIQVYDQTHDYNQSRGTAEERTLVQQQIANAGAFGLSSDEVQALQNYLNDPTAIPNRAGTPT